MKAVRSLETGRKATAEAIEPRRLTQRLVTAHPERLTYVRYGFEQGMSVREMARMTGMDPVVSTPDQADHRRDRGCLERVGSKRDGRRSACGQAHGASRTSAWPAGWNCTVSKVRSLRKELGVMPVYKMVDTCAGEFESFTPYLYSCYDEEDEAAPTERKKVLILGSGPNRIGQGIEFDYCCCHAAFALREDGYETIMVNCNPETVSTDYDTSDRPLF